MAAMEAAIPLAEKDPYRPIYHYRPPAQSLSDICAAFYFKGWHHIFYQFHPFQDHPGKGTGWGHARSEDLVTWEFLPPALLPNQGNGSDRDASGSAFFNGEGDPMLFFSMTPTSFYDEGATNKREQWAALLVDEDFIGWRRVDIGLAPGKSGVPEDIHRLWADMFVFQAEGRSFAVFKESEGMVMEPQNPNLLEWKAAGRLDDFPGECPNLFPLNENHVLIMSTYPIQYRIGYFDADKIALDST
jgi:beta-fructofuranosidase